MIETVASRMRLPIIQIYGGRVSASQSGRARHQAASHRIAEGLLARRQAVFSRRRRVVDGVYSQRTCGLLVRQSVQAIGGRGVLGQVWGSTCVSGSRDTTSDDSSESVLGKAARVQLGRNRHDGQHPKRQQSDFVWLQTLCSRGAVLVCPSIVLEEIVVVAVQRPGNKKRKAEAVLKDLVLTEQRDAHPQGMASQGSRTPEVGRVQSQAKMFTLRDTASCGDRLPSRYQREQKVDQCTSQTTQQLQSSNARGGREVHPTLRELPPNTSLE
jgi:hypothetical protein